MIAKVSSPKREELNRAKGSKLDDVKAYKKKLRVNNEVSTGEYYSITVLQYYRRVLQDHATKSWDV